MSIIVLMTRNDMRIEWANEPDFLAILKINESFSHVYSHHESFFKEGIAGGRVLIAREGDRAVGYLIYQVLWGNTPFLALVRVLPKYRGKGLGRQLLSVCEEKLKKDGFRALVSSSEKMNEEGNMFHTKIGFKNIGTVEMIYGEEVFYKKEL